jgi:hypothetical protein
MVEGARVSDLLTQTLRDISQLMPLPNYDRFVTKKNEYRTGIEKITRNY